MKQKLIITVIGLFVGIISYGQDVYLSAYKKIPSGSTNDVDKIAFSEDSKQMSVSDSKGMLAIIETETSNILKKEPASGKIIFHEFIDKEKKLLTVKSNGEFYTYPLTSFEKTKGSQTFPSPLYATLDPNQGYLTVLEKNNVIEIYDLKANMTQSRIQATGDMKNTLFLGFDRFGQQLASINNIGETYNWEFINQKFLRELKLQSGEYAGSRSVIQSAAASKGADNFVIGLQEVFIPKGGLQQGRQPERRNMLIAYDWTTGQEKKRVPVRYRPDGLALGPTPSILFYYSSDTRTIFIVNLDKGEVRESVSVDERPSSISLSDNGEILAVGTVSGMIYLYEVIRNNPAEIRIITPSINRNYGEQIVKGASVTIEGKIEGQDRMTQVVINDEKAELNPDGTFKGTVNLVPGKNRVRVAAQNTQSQFISKDVYINSEPAVEKNTPSEHSQSFNKRMALVIGNADYTSTSKLRNTLNDAKSMAQTLKNSGL